MNINFYGEVNGEKFTDLESFMNALKAITNSKEDKNISLSYETRGVNKNEKPDVKNGLAGLFANKKNPKKTIDPNMINFDVDFDSFTGDDMDEARLDKLDDVLVEKTHMFMREIHDLNVEELQQYDNINTNSLNKYRTLANVTNDKIDQLQQTIEEKQKELDYLYKSLDICTHVKYAQDGMIGYHEDLHDRINDAIRCLH